VGSIHVKALPNNNFEVTSSSKCKVDAQDKTNSIQTMCKSSKCKEGIVESS
jgi:hypothetical protein